MKYFATAKHHSTAGSWEELSAKTLTSAKREASKRLGGELQGSVIHLVECQNQIDEERLNDLPAHTKTVAAYTTTWS